MNNLIKKHPYWLVSLALIMLVASFWHFVATDRYVSQANVVLESPQVAAPTLSLQSLMTGGGGNRAEMLLLREHLLSTDMLKRMQAELDIVAHYSQPHIDFWARLRDPNPPIETLYKHILRFIEVELDDYSQVLRIRVQAYSPEMAYQLTRLLMHEGEQHMNDMGRRLAEEQIRFLEVQVTQLKIEFDQALQDLLSFQNRTGFIAPQVTAEGITAIIARLEGELATLQAQRNAALRFLSPDSIDIKRQEAEIDALRAEIKQAQARLAHQSGQALNQLTSEYQALELKMQFARDNYAAVLGALEGTRIEAARKLKQVSVLQSPTLAEYAVEPKRSYNSAVFAIVLLFLTLILQMFILIIKDHKD